MILISDVAYGGGVEFVNFTLQSVKSKRIIALAGLSTKRHEARLFFNQATHPDGFLRIQSETGLDHDAHKIVALRGTAGLYVDVPILEPAVRKLIVTYGEDRLAIPLSNPMPDLLAGLDCLLSTINHSLSVPSHTDDMASNPMADPDYVRNWLKYHADHQNVTAALILNRLGPEGRGANFSDRLRATFRQVQFSGLKRVVVLNVTVPTGRLTEGDERDVIYAPDAPGKNRMDQPEIDPWRASFGDEVLLEYVRQAFFSRASGVAYLDLSDWLEPMRFDTNSVFEEARRAQPDPLLSLNGLRAFPWRLPKNGKVSPGDHICRPFDLTAGFRRWVVSPAKVSDRDHTWRPHRIIGLSSSEPSNCKLWRFVGMRHPGASPAQLAPKSSLQESPDLVAFSKETLGCDPFRVPAPNIDKRVLGIPASERGKNIVLVTAMKNEGPFLLEWIAYHRAIGVTNFIVFTNDCTDGTDMLLDLLAASGIVEHYPNPFREVNLKPQHAGFRAAERLPSVKEADWLMTADVDEFINVHVGDGHLHDLFAAIGDANMISCTWRLFGNSDLAFYQDDFLLRQFTRCAAEDASRPHQAWGFKTLYQNNRIFKKMGVHRPKGLLGEAAKHLKWVNGSGKVMPEKERRTVWRSTKDTIGYNLVSLNHYAIRSTESFLVKRDRGRVNHVDRDQGSAYWFRMNHNTTEDRSIQRMIPTLQAEWEALIGNPEIRAAHANCVKNHRGKIAELMARPEAKTFFDTLNSERNRALSRMLPIFGSNVFLAGPECIPEQLVDKFANGQLPGDFFFSVDRPTETQH